MLPEISAPKIVFKILVEILHQTSITFCTVVQMLCMFPHFFISGFGYRANNMKYFKIPEEFVNNPKIHFNIDIIHDFTVCPPVNRRRA